MIKSAVSYWCLATYNPSELYHFITLSWSKHFFLFVLCNFYISHASFGGLNHRSSSSSITSGFNPDILLSSFSGEYNSPLSSSRAQDFSSEVGFLGFLGFSGQDIGIFEDHRPFHIVPLKNRSETICPAPKISNIKSTI